MAIKRMFTMKIVDSDAFLDMPLSTQALYFHLNMRADDDGFIGNPKRIQRLIGASDDDLKLLIAKRFVLVFENGVIVIKHWRMHNTLSANRYTETAYIDEKKALLLKDNKAYSLNSGIALDDTKRLKSSKDETNVELMLNNCRTNVEHSLNTDIDKDIDKDKGLDKDNTHAQKKPTKHKHGEYSNVLLTDDEYNKLNQDYPNAEELITFLDEYIEMKGYKAKSHYLAIKKWVVNAVAERKPKHKNDVYTLHNGSETSNPFLALLEEEENE